MQVDRIFGQGLNSNNAQIGAYNSTDPLYVNPKNAPKKFTPRGKPTGKRKTGKTRFKNGEPHITKYFKSYKDFRSNQGRKTGKVDLVLSGDLKSDYSTPPERVSNTNYVAGVSRTRNADKLEGMEEKYGDIFGLTKEEIAFFVEELKRLSFA